MGASASFARCDSTTCAAPSVLKGSRLRPDEPARHVCRSVAGAYLRARRIGGLLRLTDFTIAIGPAMNAALQAARSELFLDLIAAIGAVGPHVRSCVARIKNIFELLT